MMFGYQPQEAGEDGQELDDSGAIHEAEKATRETSQRRLRIVAGPAWQRGKGSRS
jgi:hypothetical protein